MVATLLSLKFRLTVAELRRSVARLVLWILVGLYLLSMVAALLFGLGAASGAVEGHEAVAAAITIVAGSGLTLGWILLPMVFYGADQTLDPARFSPFPLKGSQLAPGLVLAGVLGLPGFFTALICLGGALPWMRSSVGFVVGIVGGILGWAMTQVGCRVATSGLSGTLSSRKAKDMTGVIGIIVVLMLSMIGYAVSMVMAFFAGDPSRLTQAVALLGRVSAVLSWTPLGSSWALVGDAAQGTWVLFAAHLVLTVAYLAGGLWLYSAILTKALVTPTEDHSTTQVSKGDIIARVANWSWARGRMAPVAAVTARALRYWRRDPRYLGTIPAMLLMPILFTVMGRVMANPAMGDEGLPPVFGMGMVFFGLGFMALTAGYALSADVASDSTAWWLHLASGIRGWQDRAGRVIGQAMWALPLIAIVGVAVPWVIGSPARIPAALGSLFALYLVSLGVSSIFSALIIYPVALPGESPLRMKTGMMGLQMLSQFGSFLIGGLLALPVCIWALMAPASIGWLILLVGAIWGAGLLVTGVILGGMVMDSRAPAILATLVKNDSRVRA